MSTVEKAEGTRGSVVRPPGRPPKRRDQRRHILQVAAKAIATVGYEQCSLADIASELDLSPPALYHYFPTKQSIFTEIAMTAIKGIYEHVSNAVDSEQSNVEQLHAMMLAHAEYFDQNFWMINATIAGYGGITRREIEHLDEFEALRNKYEKLLQGVLRRGVKNGEFHDIDPKATTRSIFQLLNITRWYRPGGKKRAVDFAEKNFRLIINGMSVRN